MMTVVEHQPVLFNEVLDALEVQPGGIYIDATYGRGGHSDAILERLGEQGKLIAIDRDPEAIAHGQQCYSDDARVTLCHNPFSRLSELAKDADIFGSVNGILFDLGISSPHLDTPERGFSFMREGPLDMRMDSSCGMTAAQWLAEVPEDKLADVLYQYGEERNSRRIAKAIVIQRQQQPITTTKQLADVIASAASGRDRHKHPATRSFQAIRIFINEELKELETALAQALDVLAVGGRLAVMSFHSLEDRMVKQFILKQEQGEPLPRGLPAPLDFCPRVSRINGAIRPSEQEVSNNPRARSATLRVAEKLL
ncbi:MAG: 16S rRNA (cytosine(1402)-N(4))-methyltransferase RsmH [Gammaproteobacteria bacterium]|nr:16S rRNA (cytosine(1402)-N(4))-methyltransferase RsmH [Gammaproteobacteria bacterium]